ncbi:acetyl-CoA acetyltransferase [Rhodococcoides fascians]|uniref:thiolase family protein n=1 Tax=Nocardiaceae TaxID=85025 RepID=UPI000B9C5139|nr:MULTISPECIES: thiolase family protein [Rhodococcus]MBY4383809.1 thiolase family protein [Rhodococcus fascians]MBY4399020.1 thiolase family protein [Rhodococcus fascians]MBY4408558.1 thiolase family protein [Rhodococcus fascians]MBY4423597.1 thiolase family protein [Rhodococcus fascians]MBY4462879.1 thiolase family protein [Rhodococcus fascians]
MRPRQERAAVVGIAELPPERTTFGVTTLEMLARAARLAVLDAGLTPSDIDGVMCGPQVGETPQHVPATVAEYLGLQPDFADIVDLGGATGAGMLWRAAAAIEAGMCTTVLCVLGNTRDPLNVPRSPNRNPIREFDVPYGASGANQAYAMIAQRHMAEFGTTAEQLAHVAAKERANAQLNPDAVFHGKPLTVDDVLSSPMVMSPLHLFEVVMPCGGGAAFVVTSADRASASPHPPVYLLGAGEKVTHRALSQAPRLTTSPLAPAIEHAYRTAGVTASDLDFLSIYDCYSIVVAITAEDAGVCAKGEGGNWVAEHDFSHRSTLPVNTQGGQLGCGQADLAGGMTHIIEAVRQLRREAGDRQIDGAEVALVTGNGATMSEEVALVLAGVST